jgi:MFS family permease
MAGFWGKTIAYFKEMGNVSRNVKLYFATVALNGLSQGIFIVVFNLYILSMGIGADVLGAILSASPAAQAIGSIPIGFLMEIIGFKKVFFLIYGISGVAKLLQAGSPDPTFISLAAFCGGLALSGDFVARLPFLQANSSEEQRAHIYSLSSMIYAVTTALGALVAGFLPNLFGAITPNLTGAYRDTLYVAGILPLLGLVPLCFIKSQEPVAKKVKISLAPYLWGIDKFTKQQAVASLFVGLSAGLIAPFMNIYFIYHMHTTREYFGAISALAIIPAMIFTGLGPAMARKLGTVRVVSVLRVLIPPFLITLAVTTAGWLGSICYWMQNSLTNTAQPISFTFAMAAADRKTRSAVSAWLNVTYWAGQAMAAPLTGLFLAKSNYFWPMFISSIAVLLAGLSNEFYFHPMEAALKDNKAPIAQ